MIGERSELGGAGAGSVALIEGAALQLREYERRARELEIGALETKRTLLKRLLRLEESAVAAEEMAADMEGAAQDAAEILKAVAEAVESRLAPRSSAEVAPALAQAA